MPYKRTERNRNRKAKRTVVETTVRKVPNNGQPQRRRRRRRVQREPESLWFDRPYSGNPVRQQGGPARQPMFKRFDANLRSRGLERTPTSKRVDKSSEKISTLPKFPHLDQCDKEFIKARTDPFANFGKPPCNPIMNPASSIKFRIFQYMQGFAGLSGAGFAVCTPYAVGNGSRAFAVSDNNWQHANLAWDTTGATPGVNVAVINDSPVVNLSGQYKIVGCGVKVSYTGSLLQSAGTIYCYSTPSNQALTTQDITAMIGNQNCKRETFSPGKEYIEYFTTKNKGDDDWRQEYLSLTEFGAVVSLVMLGMTPGTPFVAQFALWYEWIPGALDSNLKGLLTGSEGTEHPVKISQAITDIKGTVSQTHHKATAKTLQTANNSIASRKAKDEAISNTPNKGFSSVVEHLGTDLGDGAEDVVNALGEGLSKIAGLFD